MSDLDILKDIPGYKAILKSVLKSQIQLLIEQLADHTGEESIILTASINDGTLSHLGSNTGKGFLEGRDEIKSQFLGFCLKSHHRRKTQEIQNHSRPSMPQHHPSKRSRIRPVPYSLPQTSSPITASMSVNRKGSISDITNLDQSNNIGIKAEESENADLDNFLNNVSTNVDNDYASNVPASVHLSHTQSANQNESFGDLSHSSVPNSRDDQNTMVSNVKLEPVSQDDLDIEVTGVELGDNSLSSEAWGQGYGSGGNNDNDRQSGDQAGYRIPAAFMMPLDMPGQPMDLSPGGSEHMLYSSKTVHRGGLNYKVYTCNFCGKVMTRKGDFDRHVLKHTGEKPHKCEKCEKAFTRKQILRAHMAREHMESEYGLQSPQYTTSVLKDEMKDI